MVEMKRLIVVCVCCAGVCTGMHVFAAYIRSSDVRVLTEGSGRRLKEEASDEDEDTEFFDAMEDSPAFITVTATEGTQHRSVPCAPVKEYT